MGWQNLIVGLHVFILIYRTQDCERIDFHAGAKDKSNPVMCNLK